MSGIVQTIQKELQQKGYRFSKNRDVILRVLDKADKPLTVNEIYDAAVKMVKDPVKQKLDLSTAYRIIEALCKEGFIKIISLLEGHNRYELERGDHHHHLVCTECQVIQPIHLDDHLIDSEKKIEEEKGFTVMSHSLEFFGVCRGCKINP